MTDTIGCGFSGRVKYAIKAIYCQEDSRARDNCYEMHDGDMVVTAIIRQADNDPSLQVALMKGWTNFPTYAAHPWHETAKKYRHVKNFEMATIAARLRKEAKAEFAEWIARANMTESKQRSEFTPAGEQLVMGGFERDASPTATQLDLF